MITIYFDIYCFRIGVQHIKERVLAIVCSLVNNNHLCMHLHFIKMLLKYLKFAAYSVM